MHWQRWKQHGDPLILVSGIGKPLAFRFWMKVNRDGPIPEHRPDLGPCWLWTGGTRGGPYGRFRLDGQHLLAHRVAYEMTVGPIPEGLTIDHLCRKKRCVNPAHLEPVTSAVNTRRAAQAPSTINAAKTHCVHGHEFTPENTLICGGRRRCRACGLTTSRRRRAAARLARTGSP